MDPDLNEFMDRLLFCGLFGRADIEQFRALGHRSVTELASYLETTDLLTSWQRKELSRPGAYFRHHGGYIRLSRLGEGGNATCHLVRDCRTGIRYALKQLKPNRLEDEDGVALKRFKREMKILYDLVDKNIIRIARTSLEEDPWFTMEYVGSRSLKEWAGRCFMPIPLACEICLQIARGLQAALKQEIIHRDVAPANILIVCQRDQTPLVKILDFGVARFLQDVALRDTFGPLGHAAYMSLRAVKHAQDADTTDDLFALGCIFYELLAGRLPYPRGGDLTERARNLRATVPSLKVLRPDVPDDVEAIIRRLLNLPTTWSWRHPFRSALDHFRRTGFGEPQEVVDALTRIRRSQPRAVVIPPPPDEGPTSPSPSPEPLASTESYAGS